MACCHSFLIAARRCLLCAFRGFRDWTRRTYTFGLRRGAGKCSWVTVVLVHLNPGCLMRSLRGFFKPLNHPWHGRVGNRHGSTDVVWSSHDSVPCRFRARHCQDPTVTPLWLLPAAFYVAAAWGHLGWQRAAAVASLLPASGNKRESGSRVENHLSERFCLLASPSCCNGLLEIWPRECEINK